jgi:hypothetical protein
MTINAEVREQVRRRALLACEYCGVTEADTGGPLTIDHFRPRASDGCDAFDNLLYCCNRCNEYKADYWPARAGDPALWNPRQEAADVHFLEIVDGTLFGITPTGVFTLRRLRLNRPALVAHRLRCRQAANEQQLLIRLRDVLESLERLQSQYAALLTEHRFLLREQGRLLQLMLDSR